ncbi:MAG: zinc ribbon domain-containing protein [Gemmatimonadota bacterium]
MPTYDFRCPKGHEFSRFYKTMSTALSLLPCPECGAVAERQLSAGAGLLFKGSGFYLTDYGKNAHRGLEKTSGSDKPESAGTATAADKKSDASAAAPKSEGAGTTAKSEGGGAKSTSKEGTKPTSDVRKPKSE